MQYGAGGEVALVGERWIYLLRQLGSIRGIRVVWVVVKAELCRGELCWGCLDGRDGEADDDERCCGGGAAAYDGGGSGSGGGGGGC